MKNIFGKVLGIVLGMLCFCIPLWGCAMLETSDKKVSEIDFTVVSPEELPEEKVTQELLLYIHENKTVMEINFIWLIVCAMLPVV